MQFNSKGIQHNAWVQMEFAKLVSVAQRGCQCIMARPYFEMMQSARLNGEQELRPDVTEIASVWKTKHVSKLACVVEAKNEFWSEANVCGFLKSQLPLHRLGRRQTN